ncbi:MAG: porin [Burkholderiales bacterium]
MKRFQLCTLFVAALAASAGAQAQVTLSGFIDVNMEKIKSGGLNASRVSSGGLNTSRLQFKAEEDLGGGLRAKAVHEMTFAADTGAQGTPRETYVQLASKDWGEVSLGRQNLPSYYLYGYADPSFSSDYSRVSNMMVFFAPFRENNAVAYNSPRMAGLQLKLLATTGKEDGSKNGRVTSVAVDYRNGPLFVGFAADKKYQSNIFAPARMESARDNYLAAVYTLGQADLTFIYHTYNGYYAFPPFVDFRSSGHDIQIGTRYNINSLSRVFASLVRKNDKNDTSLSDATGVVVGYLHGLSKRTHLYATYATTHHSKNSPIRYPVAFGAANPLANENPQGIQLGIRHAF